MQTVAVLFAREDSIYKTLPGFEFSEHELISRAVRAASGNSRRGTQRWVAMKDAFGCGSGVANALCHRFGFDPDEMVKP